MQDRRSEGMTHSWVDVPDGCDFPLENLPYGAFRRSGDAAPRIGVAIGAHILDLRVVAQSGLLRASLPQAAAVFAEGTLNPFLRLGIDAWRATRARVSELLSAGNAELAGERIAEGALVRQAQAELLAPIEVSDYVDFYSSLEHAVNLGKLLRPGAPPLTPNWRWLPLGYHGRAASVVAGGTPIVRPRGQSMDRPAQGAGAPHFGPTRMLDFEIELGFVTGEGPPLGTPIGVAEAERSIFGAVLLNDWSARDLQAWENQPLGPFLSKSFATSISPWVVPLEALAPFRVAGPVQDPPPLSYLAAGGARGFEVALTATLASAAMTARGLPPLQVSRTNSAALYWTPDQQLAHLTSNGARVRAGGLCGTGTISGSEPGSYGSMIETTRRGEAPLELPDGSRRVFLEDGDTVVFHGRCSRPGATALGFGELIGTILPSPPL
jgi:fumarylacetoacetase